MEKALKYELRRCGVEAKVKIAEDLEDGIIAKHCTSMLINCEGVVNPNLSQLKIGTGP